jgi:hypothetical protein
MKAKQPIKRVDFLGNDSDYEAAFLGSLGFSTRCIITRTKLRPGQVTYRLKKASIRRIDYRDGTSDMASLVLRQMRPAIEDELNKYLKVLLKDGSI